MKLVGFEVVLLAVQSGKFVTFSLMQALGKNKGITQPELEPKYYNKCRSPYRTPSFAHSGLLQREIRRPGH